MTYYRIEDIELVLGESQLTGDTKGRFYGQMADNYINAKLINVKDLEIPISPVSNTLRNIATSLAIAYFFKFESGDTDLAITAEQNIDMWFNSSFQRPRFKARGC